MTSLNRNASKILRTILDCPSDLYEAGLGWYADAHGYAVTLAERYGYSTSIVAGVIAALSPQTGWEQNKAAAERTLAAHAYGQDITQAHTSQTQANTAKAMRIMDGESPEVVLCGNMPKSGHKVWSFYNNILSPTTSQHVTIDRHAIRIWQTEQDTWTCITPNRYARMQEDYQTVARVLGILPHQAQSISWTVIRGTAE